MEGEACLAHGGACVALRELAHGLAPFSVVQEDLPVRSDAREVVSTRRVPHVLHELGVRLYRLLTRKAFASATTALRVERARDLPCLFVPIWSP
jgi:hypothetical protein